MRKVFGFALLMFISSNALAQNAKGDSTNYRLHIGTSFDFLNRIKASDLYADLNIFLPALEKGSRYGLMVSMYQARSVSKDSSTRLIASRVPGRLTIESDSVTIFRRDARLSSVTTIDNLGLFVAPSFALRSGKSNTLYGIVQLEIIRRNLLVDQRATFSDPDTVRIPVSEERFYPGFSEQLLIKQQYSIGYIGIGGIFDHSDDYVHLMLKGVVGIKNRQRDEGQGFYSIYFQVREKKFGIVLGGEVRGSFPSDEPYINIYLAKSFSLSKLAEFLTGGG